MCAGTVAEVIQSVLNGADGCVFCFGHSKLGNNRSNTHALGLWTGANPPCGLVASCVCVCIRLCMHTHVCISVSVFHSACLSTGPRPSKGEGGGLVSADAESILSLLRLCLCLGVAPSNPSQAGFWEKLFSSKGARTPRCRPWRVLTQTRAQTNTFLTPRSDPVVFTPVHGCSIIPLGFWSSDNQSEFSESPWTAGRGQKQREFKLWFSPRITFFCCKESQLFYFIFIFLRYERNVCFFFAFLFCEMYQYERSHWMWHSSIYPISFHEESYYSLISITVLFALKKELFSFHLSIETGQLT